MKFSHSLKFNAVPEWQDNYVNYPTLKKIIYKLQQDQLINNGSQDEDFSAKNDSITITEFLEHLKLLDKNSGNINGGEEGNNYNNRNNRNNRRNKNNSPYNNNNSNTSSNSSDAGLYNDKEKSGSNNIKKRLAKNIFSKLRKSDLEKQSIDSANGSVVQLQYLTLPTAKRYSGRNRCWYWYWYWC
ncbi:conserved hypothetical protein [Lodderomyces elongisporus NRRL YB-4239]|uniref:SPX domain-containing protein n=1 Tax=Lodderomyces elongisporus (strain ATCC 11503 / CBS 2605 / JCM 1781 / NBRC 1676 / NRRL YB-4239) TaxID=379508 RepID=A5DWG8_LODEL|nr:conserved hypothetical protein [Lodderomyces elongisporus NRRL YB-4239]